MNRHYIILVIVLIILGCSKESDFVDSVFIPDEQYPTLPAYTELGFNTFGANYERTEFIYSEDLMPFKVRADSMGLALIFQGYVGGEYYTEMILEIALPDTEMTAYQDLLKYNDSIIDLVNPSIKVQFRNPAISRSVEVHEGLLHVKRARTLFVDDQEQHVVLSGTFGLQYLVGGVPSQLSEGRFDVNINHDNFYKLNSPK